MFDPTIFDNLKVALENHLYDLDNLDRRIRITNRIDRIDLAVLCREFVLQFRLSGDEKVKAEIRLEASLRDLAWEILETEGKEPGCKLTLRFDLQVEDVPGQCRKVEEILQNIWKPKRPPTQTLRFRYGGAQTVYDNMAELTFDRRIDEEQMGDLPDLIGHILLTLEELRNV